jgi:hypothetical protein
MNIKSLFVNTSEAKAAVPRFCQQAIAPGNITPMKIVRKEQNELIPHITIYRNPMYYEYTEIFCQYPFDIGI